MEIKSEVEDGITVLDLIKGLLSILSSGVVILLCLWLIWYVSAHHSDQDKQRDAVLERLEEIEVLLVEC